MINIKLAQFAAGQAAVVAHVAAHELGAAAYAIKAVQTAAPKSELRARRRSDNRKIGIAVSCRIDEGWARSAALIKECTLHT